MGVDPIPQIRSPCTHQAKANRWEVLPCVDERDRLMKDLRGAPRVC